LFYVEKLALFFHASKYTGRDARDSFHEKFASRISKVLKTLHDELIIVSREGQHTHALAGAEGRPKFQQRDPTQRF